MHKCEYPIFLELYLCNNSMQMNAPSRVNLFFIYDRMLLEDYMQIAKQ